MNEIGPQQLLAQIRALQSEMQSISTMPAATNGQGGFGESLKTAIDSVNDAQAAAKKLRLDFEAERGGADLTEVMIAAQKASLSFRAMTEVRNKLVTAYQDIMNMPV
ncbi:MAG: flagellar hook-basal body complex protein FliE [Holophagales bacterium]|nr:flagellar hook-basal body complex protein FliE [Holophagales bacterium]